MGAGKGGEDFEETALDGDYAFFLGVQNDEGHVGFCDFGGAAFEEDILVDDHGAGAGLLDLGDDLDGVAGDCWMAVADVDVDDDKCPAFALKFLEVHDPFVMPPACLFEEFQVTGIVDVAVGVGMVAPDGDFSCSFSHLGKLRDESLPALCELQSFLFGWS